MLHCSVLCDVLLLLFIHETVLYCALCTVQYLTSRGYGFPGTKADLCRRHDTRAPQAGARAPRRRLIGASQAQKSEAGEELPRGRQLPAPRGGGLSAMEHGRRFLLFCAQRRQPAIPGHRQLAQLAALPGRRHSGGGSRFFGAEALADERAA